MCYVRLGDTDQGVPLLEESARKLNDFCLADPDNGQARRYRDSCFDEAAEALRRAGEAERAQPYFDRVIEWNGGVVAPKFMSDHIDQTVGLMEFEAANALLNEYSPVLLEQRTLLGHAEVLANTIRSLDNLDLGSDTTLELQAKKTRARLVSLACQLLGKVLENSDAPERSMKTITERKELAILLGEAEFVQLILVHDR
jgi:hypothetical protein